MKDEYELEVFLEYTEVRPVVVEDEPDAHTVWLVVGVQQFCLANHSETKKGAEWTRRMLSAALGRIVAEVKTREPDPE